MSGSVYSTYEAKAKFSEILRKVRAGESVFVSYRGREVAEIRPVERAQSVEEKYERLVERGFIAPARNPEAPLVSGPKRPGALARFLESRD